MSDLSLLAAALAQITAADQPTRPESPVISGPSAQLKHQSVQPIALKLHQASIETYRAEFSPAPAQAQSRIAAQAIARIPAPPPSAAPVIRIAQPRLLAGATSIARGSRLGDINLATAMPQIWPDLLPKPLQLGLRPILTHQGGSISALGPAARPLALKLHQASVETYATLAASASPVQRPPIARRTEASRPLTVTASLSPATLALGMAQAAGVAQSVADRGAPSLPMGSPGSASAFPLDSALLANAPAPLAAPLAAPLLAAPPSAVAPPKPSAVQAAIALDRRVRQELQQEAMAISKASALPPAQSMAGQSRPAQSSLLPSIPVPPVGAAPTRKQPIARSAALTPVALRPDSQSRSPSQPQSWPAPLPTPFPAHGPQSGPQLYQQRLAALKQGRLHSRLPVDSFKSIWSGVREKPSYGQWQRLLAAEARSVGGGQGNNRLSIVLGDSLSLWLPMQPLSGSQLWLNQGISGDTTRGILNRLEPLQQTRPSRIYIMAGINDLKNGASDDEVVGNLQTIVQLLRQQHPQAQIYVQSILPASIGLAPGRIQQVNGRIAQVAQAERVSFLNLYPQFVAPNGQMIAQFTTDGLHLSSQGYAVWQSVLRNMERWANANLPQSAPSS